MSRPQYQVAPSCNKDLDEIWLQIALDSPIEADKFIDKVISKFPLIATMPMMGADRPDIYENIRSHAYGRYIIFWRVVDDEAHFLHIIHGAREFDNMNIFMDDID